MLGRKEMIAISLIFYVAAPTLGVIAEEVNRESKGDQLQTFHVDSSNNFVVDGSGITMSTIDQSYYTFEPKDDITASELAQALKLVLPAMTCHNVFNPACDPREAIKSAPEGIKRHFAYHEH